MSTRRRFQAQAGPVGRSWAINEPGYQHLPGRALARPTRRPPCAKRVSPVSRLSLERQAFVIAHLCEGVGIRATERLTGVHRDTVMRLGVAVGEGCVAIHQRFMTGLSVSYVEMDELWSFVKKKPRSQSAPISNPYVGEQYIFIAFDPISKAILTWHVGKRTSENTDKIAADLRTRLRNDPCFSTDGFPPYQSALNKTFENSPRGIVDKKKIVSGTVEVNGTTRNKYTVEVKFIPVAGTPDRIGTSHIERQNLTLRQSQRRMTRCSSGFSKKFRNHCAAVSLYATHYNFCRIHESLRVTPAMQLGIADRVWSVEELVHATLSGEIQAHLFAIKGRFHVIAGGRA